MARKPKKSDDEIRTAVLAHFAEAEGEIDTYDLAEKCGVSVRQVFRVCEQLGREGKLWRTPMPGEEEAGHVSMPAS